MKSRVAVEKLFFDKFAKMKLREDALEAIFSDFKAFCITRILAVFEERRVFQHPRDFSPTERLSIWRIRDNSKCFAELLQLRSQLLKFQFDSVQVGFR